MPVQDNASVASVDLSRKRSFKETLRLAVSPADKEKLEKINTKCKFLKQTIKAFSGKVKTVVVEELHDAENKAHELRRKVDSINKRVNEKKALLENLKNDKLELVEKMNVAIDMAGGPSDASDGEASAGNIRD